MDIASQYADVYTDFQGLSQLRAEAGNNDKETLRKVAGQFEALFIQMMLKSMRDASLGEGLMDSEQVKTYQSMFDQQLALDLSKRNSLGLADMMVRQLSRNDETAAVADPDAAVAAPTGALPATRAYLQQKALTETAAAEDGERQQAAHAAAARDDWKPQSPEAFVHDLWPHAQRAAAELGTRPDVLIAQAALETGWGQHMIRHQDGGSSYNLFGIKADYRWQGEQAVTETVEYRDGIVRRERAAFRSYDSLADSFDDYVQFLKASPRYRQALEQAGDAAAYTGALADAGYATDPEYSSKINRIMDGSQLRGAVSDIKEISREPLI